MPLTPAQSVDLLRYRLAAAAGYYLRLDGSMLRIGKQSIDDDYWLFLTTLNYLHSVLRHSPKKATAIARIANAAWLRVKLDAATNAAWRVIWEELNK